MSDYTNIKVDFAKMQPSEQQFTPRELALGVLGYVPEGTPETWDEVDVMLAQHGQSSGEPATTSYLKWGRDIVPPLASGLDDLPEKGK